MAITANKFETSNGLTALLDTIYAVKFSKHVPLIMVMLFAVFATWRTNHYIGAQINVNWLVSVPLAFCIEIAMLAAGASCFITLRDAYIRELKQEDADRAKLGVWAAFTALAIVTLALLILAGADGYLESNGSIAFVLLMLLIQFAQSCMILIFINTADLEEREKLRERYANYVKEQTQQQANECPYCRKLVLPNNRKRHMDACPNKP